MTDTTTTTSTDGQVPEDRATPVIDELAAEKPATKAKAKKPAEKKAEKPSHITTRKVAGEPTEGQVCLGPCGKWKPLTEYGRTSKARGNRPMRRCRACISAEAKARKAAATKDAPAAKPEKKSSRKTAKAAAASSTRRTTKPVEKSADKK